ncbi:transcriptional repressor AgaR [Flagellimonas eckloniae]|uniref:DeoR faimly transcriptional regulator n=1 Tax=Flagellimonas eckloniae TaxID=346185 RepID=A0A0Q1C0N9_9FLAO|nr:transcriptional repressor AgaR [Allomuricauda eckloniae]KQC30725.1 DeoR faimly transcriptional regulator [Allomuricauda eckloniae]
MEKKNKKRSTVERRKKILNMLDENGQVFVHELSDEFKVSEVTIRNDLDLFESKKLLLRSRGGAMKYENSVSMDFQISDKDKIHYAEKIKIGKKAAALVNNGETIIVDSGTTTMEIVKNLNPSYSYNVITNAFNIANQLINAQNINIIVPGGTLRKNSHSLVGPLAEKSLRNFYVDKVFIGVDGFDTSQGAFTPNIEEASLNQVMIDIAKEVILVADSSKFQRRSLAFICPLDKIDIVVTDEKISKEDLKKLEEVKIKVIIA